MSGSHRSSRGYKLALASSLLASSFATGAHASTAVSIYTAAARVEMLPAESTATEVVIHGAFMFLDASGNYSDAVCGTMYFRCPAGSEAMCRLQWQDIRTMGTSIGQCAGFGSVGTVSSAHVRAEGAVLAGPDVWDLGVGVQSGSYIGGKCEPAKRMACAQPGPIDAGVVDAPTAIDGPSTLDGQLADGPGWSEAGAHDVLGGGAAAEDLADGMDGASGRDTLMMDMITQDAPAISDSALADAYVATANPDGSADKVGGASADATMGERDAGATENRSEGSGCGCRLGGSPRRSDGHGPAPLLLLTALFGILGSRRVRR